MSRPAVLAASLITALAATPAPAQGWLTLDFPGAPARLAPVAGGAGITRFSMLDAVGIEAAGEAGAETARLVIEIALPPDAAPGTLPLDARVTYRPDGFRNYWQTADLPPPGAIVLEDVALRGPAPRLAGRFEVVLCRRASVMVPADAGDCRSAAGAFDTPLQID
ncbi:hypothetical protein [Pararhodobacter sp. SW119]|uniref:hypothetical protein n=1 Tax=Pararhodobacter sp. SW119 TaxID=2780075 RepID=UPI001ADF5934|nr:hypothetical protein [Pararhodobacter sp. SW119]